MAEQLDDGKKRKEYVSIESILNNPSDKSKLVVFLNQAVEHKQRIALENDGIKTLRQDAAETIGLEPKLFNQLVRVSFNNSFTETKAEISALESAIEILFPETE